MQKIKKLSFDSEDEVRSGAVASGNRETKKWKTEKAAQPVFETLCSLNLHISRSGAQLDMRGIFLMSGQIN